MSARARGCGQGLRAEFSTGDRCTFLSRAQQSESRRIMREVLKATARIFAGRTLQISVLVRHVRSLLSIQSRFLGY